MPLLDSQSDFRITARSFVAVPIVGIWRLSGSTRTKRPNISAASVSSSSRRMRRNCGSLEATQEVLK